AAKVPARLLRLALRRRPVRHLRPGSRGRRAPRRARRSRHHEADAGPARSRPRPAAPDRTRGRPPPPIGRPPMRAPRPARAGESGALLARWGRFVHRARWTVLGLSGLALCASLWVIHVGGQLHPPDIPTDTESGRARRLLEKQLQGQPPSFSLIF